MTRAAFLPESWRGNPVLDLMEQALETQGVEVVRLGTDYLGVRWLWRRRKEVDVLHFHWLQYHYRRDSAPASWWALGRFGAKLLFIRLCGYRLVWTMHNLLPHERAGWGIDRLAALLMAHLARSVVVHCEEGRRALWRTHRRRRRAFVAYLGPMTGPQATEMTRADARARLGIAADRLVYLFFGAVRPYKGLEELIAAFSSLADERSTLLIAGQAGEPAFGAHVAALAQADPRIRARIGWLPDDELAVYLSAADVAVLPFSRVLTSSSVLTALTLGRPVVAPALGCLPEIVPPEAGLLYDPDQSGGLRRALEACRGLDLVAMGRRARARAATFRWDELARQTIRAYEA